jgi:hypothetical protein
LQGLAFENNSGLKGGALRVTAGGSVALLNSSFVENMAALGSAVLVDEGGQIDDMHGCDFLNNTQLAEQVTDNGDVVMPVDVFSEYAIAKYAER